MRLCDLPARDLRLLDPVFVHSSIILGREKALVVNLEQIRFIITADEVLLLNSLDKYVIMPSIWFLCWGKACWLQLEFFVFFSLKLCNYNKLGERNYFKGTLEHWTWWLIISVSYNSHALVTVCWFQRNIRWEMTPLIAFGFSMLREVKVLIMHDVLINI